MELRKAAQDRYLLWIYARNVEGAIPPIQEESSPKGPENKNSPTNSHDEVGDVEITSSSDTEDAEASSHHQEVTGPPTMKTMPQTLMQEKAYLRKIL